MRKHSDERIKNYCDARVGTYIASGIMFLVATIILTVGIASFSLATSVASLPFYIFSLVLLVCAIVVSKKIVKMEDENEYLNQ